MIIFYTFVGVLIVDFVRWRVEQIISRLVGPVDASDNRRRTGGTSDYEGDQASTGVVLGEGKQGGQTPESPGYTHRVTSYQLGQSTRCQGLVALTERSRPLRLENGSIVSITPVPA